MIHRILPLLTASLIALSAGVGPGAAQVNPFAPRIIINDRAVTEYEFQQRLLFMRLLNAPGDPEKEAMDALIADRLRVQEAKRLGMKPDEKAVLKGMEEFAGRARMTVDEFTKALGGAGVAPETFRDFVAAGVIWREVVRAKFGSSVTVSEAEIDRTIEGETRKMALAVAVSELIIPAPPGEEEQAMALARRIQSEVKSEAGFAAAAAQYSATGSREQGGRLPMMSAANLPPQVSGVILALSPGQVSAPLALPGAVALFQLRDIAEMRPENAAPVQVEYARLTLPPGEDSLRQIAQVQVRADTCKDIYGILPGLPESQMRIETHLMSEIPADLGMDLARLDPGESAVRNRGTANELLMLCARQPAAAEPVNRNAVRESLLNRKLEAQSDLYLARLRADALIRKP
ncbi:MAG: peptidylprolyl isomerase [Gemmobacter sp.]|jgi:peptidyl-prolyl cis-trans isomerase SurA|nr:peptidylprolyl isomerase [Gemmobacter sp.]